MKTIFDTSVREELRKRIESLTENHTAKWGKMNVHQMIRHCKKADEMYHGTLKIKRVFIGKIFGKMVLKKFIKDETAFSKNSPTSGKLKTGIEPGNFTQEKNDWLTELNKYENFYNPDFVHPFFGAMSKEEIGILAYKHADHHLRQFGA